MNDEIGIEDGTCSESGRLLRRLTRYGALLSALMFAFSGTPSTDGIQLKSSLRGYALAGTTSGSASTEANSNVRESAADGSSLRSAIAEVEIARHLLAVPELLSEAALHRYVMTLDQILTSYEGSARGQGLSTALGFARSALASQVENLAAWTAVRRAVDPDGVSLENIPDRFISGEVAIQRISPPSAGDVVTWMVLDSLHSA